ncbi:hypothetical protein [Kangiella sediminilitoris]|uniref:Uncharacterized protein n=1 Tax=Kangiella sediminilitoris TaxID=1144748 RepID=A0A1B3B808_9GAMM|nr:hypothetical protein [Kangiella sediminilitoris]AOE48932.1 hypothetical protein KS2013_204 [Kangiella sediminilitoris]
MKQINTWLIIISLAIASLLAGSKALDFHGEQYTDQVLKRSLVAFAVARGLNGLISVAQEAEIAMQPAGVGLTLSPGEILDPINDLIERFSVVMLITASAIGVQKLMLTLSAWAFFNYTLIAFWIFTIVYLLYCQYKHRKFPSFTLKVAAFLVLVRFTVPVMALTSEGLYQAFMVTDYQQASQGLEQTENTIRQNTPEDQELAEEDLSAFEKTQRWLSDAASQLDVKKQIAAYQQAAEQASQSVIKLITIFIVQTILFPLIFLWLAIKIGRGLIKKRHPV